MSDIRFTKDHEWVRVEGEFGVVGISDYAQHQLGDVVFVELPNVGQKVAQGGQAAVVESVKAASEVYSPVAGEITEVNGLLDDAPGTVNDSPLDHGWFFKIKIANAGELAGLMDQDAYDAYVKGLE